MKNLTIIIPTFNSEKYIEKTLSHLVSQTSKDFRVIVIDDNSKDNTRKIAEKFKTLFSLDIVNKSSNYKTGGASSINLGFKLVNTKYWALIDSDAFLKKNWVKEMLKELKNKNVVGAPIYAYKNGGLVAFLIGLDIEQRYSRINKKWVRHLSTCNIAGNVDVLKYIHLNDKLKYAYDHELSFQLKKNGVLFYLTKNTGCYHVNKNGFMNYFFQQYKIAKYHLFLSKKMGIEAREGDEISPNYLILQPFFMALSLILIPFFPIWATICLIIVLILNYSYILFGLRKNIFYLPLLIVLVYIKNIAWIIGSFEGLLRKDIN